MKILPIAPHILLAAGLLATAGGWCAVPARSDFKSVVVGLYKAYAWTALTIDATAGATIERADFRILSRFFTPELSRAIRRDADCVAGTREICKLGFQILWASQDPTVRDLRFETTDPLTVEVCYRNDRMETVCIVTVGELTPHGPRIADLRYRHMGSTGSAGSLRATLDLMPLSPSSSLLPKK